MTDKPAAHVFLDAVVDALALVDQVDRAGPAALVGALDRLKHAPSSPESIAAFVTRFQSLPEDEQLRVTLARQALMDLKRDVASGDFAARLRRLRELLSDLEVAAALVR